MFIKTNRETSATRIQNNIINFDFFEDNLLEVVKVVQCGRVGREKSFGRNSDNIFRTLIALSKILVWTLFMFLDFIILKLTI